MKIRTKCGMNMLTRTCAFFIAHVHHKHFSEIARPRRTDLMVGMSALGVTLDIFS